MEVLFLLKYGEISLKGKNRPQFERCLLKNINTKLQGIEHKLSLRLGRILLFCHLKDEIRVKEALGEIPGLQAYAKTFSCEKNLSAILNVVKKIIAENPECSVPRTFKIEARRTDKSFPLTSYELACQIGSLVKTEFPHLTVDVHLPSLIINLEIREKAYIYLNPQAGLGGLPVGCNGRGLLLLSGGIDSPVAGFFMGKRGLTIEALYFHTPPFTSPEAQKKVKELCLVLKRFIPGLRLWQVNFTELQVYLKEHVPLETVTLMSRACMMIIAEQIARAEKIPVLITGESLGQVASQTPESLAFTESFVKLPVLRPLIGLDKEEIIGKARFIGTYPISIKPFADCCSLFAPPHPLIKPNVEKLRSFYLKLPITEKLQTAFENRELLEL